MAVSVASISIPQSTLQASPQITEISLSQPFLRRIEIQILAAAFGLVGVRLSTENSMLFPAIGVGMSSWFTPLTDRMEIKQYTRLDGPPYRIQIETYNTDSSARLINILFETDHYNYEPVNLMITAKQPSNPEQPKGDPSKQENLG
jgi:hypothetical protein